MARKWGKPETEETSTPRRPSTSEAASTTSCPASASCSRSSAGHLDHERREVGGERRRLLPVEGVAPAGVHVSRASGRACRSASWSACVAISSASPHARSTGAPIAPSRASGRRAASGRSAPSRRGGQLAALLDHQRPGRRPAPAGPACSPGSRAPTRGRRARRRPAPRRTARRAQDRRTSACRPAGRGPETRSGASSASEAATIEPMEWPATMARSMPGSSR